MTTGKTIALTRQTFLGKVMSPLFNMLSRLVITFLPRSKRLLISWLQSPSAVILEPPKIKSDTVSPSISHEVTGPDAMILVFWMLSCGWEELPQAQSQGWQLGGATPCPSSGGCTGAGGLRGATPRSRSGGATVRRYPSSKVRRSSCALLEQLWRDTLRPR